MVYDDDRGGVFPREKTGGQPTSLLMGEGVSRDREVTKTQASDRAITETKSKIRANTMTFFAQSLNEESRAGSY